MILAGLLWAMSGWSAEFAPLTFKESNWKTFTKQSFRLEGRNALVVISTTSAAGKPWIWRTSFPNYHPEVDVELVKPDAASRRWDGTWRSSRSIPKQPRTVVITFRFLNWSIGAIHHEAHRRFCGRRQLIRTADF